MYVLRPAAPLVAVLTCTFVALVGAHAKKKKPSFFSKTHDVLGDPSLKTGEKLVYFIRHAEGTHNLGNLWERDAPLTDDGLSQATHLLNNRLLSQALSHDPERRVQLIIMSPMRRTMQTALAAFNNLQPPIEHWELSPDIQETGSFGMDPPCNQGDPSAGPVLLADYNRTDLASDYSKLPKSWEVHSGDLEPGEEHVRARFKRFTKTLLQHPEQRIFVVTHGDFLLVNLGVYRGNAGVLKRTLTEDGNWHETSCATRILLHICTIMTALAALDTMAAS